ncbi:MAG: histone deacetylase family protein [Methanotrichaceae archaeon]|nr:histone deacetylase family protein [Methanotrichaceae archaeon]
MKIVYSKKFEQKYPTNPIENPDRVSLPAQELQGYEFIEPGPANMNDIARIHGREHIEIVQHRGLYEAASLAAGGAVMSAELAMQGEPSFALIRPPGHHASANRSWGLCFFNNLAIAIQKIRPKARRVLIIDIDLHYGDGTVSIFRGDRDVKIVNPGCLDAEFDYLNLDAGSYIELIEDALNGAIYDIIGVSAGFDTYVEDWGRLLRTEDYREIGRVIRDGSLICKGRRFAVFEGGYHPDLKYNIKSFIKGFE